MILSDFFNPPNLFNIFLIFFIFFQLEILGTFFASKLNLPDYTRPSWWILGLATHVFVWFILHFFIPFNQGIVLLIFLGLGGLALPFYYQEKSWKSLLRAIADFPWLFLLILLVARNLFLWISAPPYAWDEMAYHFYSPANLVFEEVWPFDRFEFYTMLPRFFETGFVLFFSATRTHVAARILHFAIFFSNIFSIAIFLRRRIHWFVAFLFSVLMLFLSTSTIKSATTGYIDIGTASIILLAFISLSALIIEGKLSDLRSLVVWLSLALASKYSVLMFVLASVLLLASKFFSSYLIQLKDSFKNEKNNFLKKSLTELGLISMIFFFLAGFWYAKNALLTWNPLYPFVFNCKQDLVCSMGQDFLSGFTLAFSWENRQEIINSVFQKEQAVFHLTVLSLIATALLGFMTKNKYVKKINSLLIILISLEILIAFKITGFHSRYYSHWNLLVPIALSLPWFVLGQINKFKKDKAKYYASIFFVIVLAWSQYSVVKPVLVKQLEDFNKHEAVPTEILAYAKGQIDIYDWTRNSFPDYYPAIHWCGEKREKTILLMTDPELIWWSGNGLARAFFVYCKFDADLIGHDNSREEEKIKKYIQDEAYLTSLVPCDENLENKYTDKKHREYFKLNQELICQSEEIVPGIYKLKN
ncbi:MAG: hypothetical protein ABFQ62_03470 [Patescibacteria group bacterium]